MQTLLSTQRKFEERLDKRIRGMEEHQLSMSATLDSSLFRIYTDMHQLAGGLLDIAQRLEEKLDTISNLGRGAGEQQVLQQTKRSFSEEGATEQVLIPSGAGEPLSRKIVQPASWSNGPNITRNGQVDKQEKKKIGVRDSNFGKHSSSGVVGGRSGWNRGLRKSMQDGPSVAEGELVLHTQLLESAQLEESSSLPDSQTVGKKNSLTTKASKAHLSRQVPKEAGTQIIEAFAKPQEVSEITTKLLELDSRFMIIDKKLEQIAGAVVVRGTGNENDDEEDRKRLKEKLKLAIEADRRSRVRTIVSQGEVWLEYIFGICAPDQRLGKRGSRYPHRVVLL
jgi:hypothetical protein